MPKLSYSSTITVFQTYKSLVVEGGEGLIPNRSKSEFSRQVALNEHGVFKQPHTVWCYENIECRGTGKVDSRI